MITHATNKFVKLSMFVVNLFIFFLLFIRMFSLSHILFGTLFWLSDSKQKNCKVSFNSLHSVFAILHAVCRCGLIVKFKRHIMYDAFADCMSWGICCVSTRHVSTYGLLSLSLWVRAYLNIINYTRNLMFCCFKSIVVMP